MDISKLDKANVLIALYDAARAQGLGIFNQKSGGLSYEEATALLEKQTYFDYLYGRVMKVNLGKDNLDTRLYNRDNGISAAEIAIENAFNE